MEEIKHPYKDFEKTKIWELIDKSIDDLIKNQDIELTTRKEYVIGYISKIIIQNLSNINE